LPVVGLVAFALVSHPQARASGQTLSPRPAYAAGAALASVPAPVPAPDRRRLLIYYGDLDHCNGARDVEEAGRFLAQWDFLIMEPSLDVAGVIYRHNPDALIFYYIDIGNISRHPSSVIKSLVDRHKSRGAGGIFLDCAGYDFEVSRQRLNEMLDYVHAQGLYACVNAWHPEDVMENAARPVWNPDALETHMGARDFYLAEDFLGLDSSPERVRELPAIKSKSDKLVAYRRRLGVRMLATGTLDFSTRTQAGADLQFELLEVAASIWAFDGYGLCAPEYSASGPNHNVARAFIYDPGYPALKNVNVSSTLADSGKTIRRPDCGAAIHDEVTYFWFDRPTSASRVGADRHETDVHDTTGNLQ